MGILDDCTGLCFALLCLTEMKRERVSVVENEKCLLMVVRACGVSRRRFVLVVCRGHVSSLAFSSSSSFVLMHGNCGHLSRTVKNEQIL